MMGKLNANNTEPEKGCTEQIVSELIWKRVICAVEQWLKFGKRHYKISNLFPFSAEADKYEKERVPFASSSFFSQIYYPQEVLFTLVYFFNLKI